MSSSDDIDLMGIDHPLLQQELARWRDLPAEQLGVAVKGADAGPALLSLWLVESSLGSGERLVSVQSIAVKPDGARIPGIERHAAQLLRGEPTAPVLTPEQRLALFSGAVEPTLQRELRHRGAGDGSYSAELIGYVELV